ncbi:MAG: deoxyribose-phosphate aldolase [Acholeplasmatales bacterium]|jgi:deoxyribose-phosphate aldolase|nr:deoxyribose-phosphate aldolase [Acholeplasmataceae bacterium]MDY0115284.1 deoxyribose-phosphate aldolase [Acholeplasmatales bacterium]MCK9233845.1 deoxyribose-phosphate aldolase [Acholeplasmataceae bacterium]MCK9289219.1 deoxyribose-phosphate aldolase [Acholeplasmataceae bacterium]MCK9427675.1 deoxyribose-phosphate aldolase [Acholeplasmataceae bacterium]
MTLNKYIDHTKLGPTVTKEEIIKLCEEARKYDFMSVCVDPIYVSLAKKQLENSGVLVCTVVGFPHGTSTTKIKFLETEEAILAGADEIDMVINQNALKNKDYDYLLKETQTVKSAVGDKTLKVILETSNLSKEEIVKACLIAKEARADFVKTSTGFSRGGATVEDVSLMRETVKTDLGVKASGGIRTYEDAQAMIEAGANRIGASQGINIVTKKTTNDEKSY